MRAMPRKAAKYLFPFTHHLVDHPMDIGKRGAKRVNHLLKTFASLLLTRKRVDFYEINRHKIISSLKLTLVYDLLGVSVPRYIDGCRRPHGRKRFAIGGGTSP